MNFEDFLRKKLAGDMGGMGDPGDMESPGSGGNLPEYSDQPEEEAPEDPDAQGPQEGEEENARIMGEFVMANPGLIQSLGGVDAVIEALKNIAGEGQDMMMNPEGAQPEDNASELSNKLESILNPVESTGPENSPAM